jgi:hypothetical protein
VRGLTRRCEHRRVSRSLQDLSRLLKLLTLTLQKTMGKGARNNVLEQKQLELNAENARLAHRSVRTTAIASVLAAVLGGTGTHFLARASDGSVPSDEPKRGATVAAHVTMIRACRLGLMRAKTRAGLAKDQDPTFVPFIQTQVLEPCIGLTDGLLKAAEKQAAASSKR